MPIHLRGSYTRLGRIVPRRLPNFFVGDSQPSIAGGSGRRELARWVASKENPLTARVIVNRVWQWHFGEGLVRTPNNFGMLSRPPSHPELLDWLAQRFIADGWSLKKKHRVLVDRPGPCVTMLQRVCVSGLKSNPMTIHAITTRREMLARSGSGFGMLALAHLLATEGTADAARSSDRAANPYAVRQPHHVARAKRVIFLYMPGGPSHVDLFDPKPRLAKDNGKPLPFDKPKLERTKTGNLLASPWKFAPHGQSGTEVSELLPRVASHVDDICVIRSLVADNINQPIAALLADLKQRGLLEDTLVLWGGEFGRTPTAEGNNGRDYRLTDVHGRVVEEIVA